MGVEGGMSILVVDYGMGNLASVKRAFEECGASVFVSQNPADAAKASKLVLPGVGSFAMAMDNIRASGWYDALRESSKTMPLLGICLGMQLLADEGEEHGATAGLGLIPGRVRKLEVAPLRVPHVGWNEISKRRDDPLLQDIESGTDFYFVHSYYFDAANDEDVLATTPYGGNFPTIVARGRVWGTQFHPEKSGLPGFQLIRNFVSMV